MNTFIPRPAQREILAYTGGTMAVSAVPGSGKTATLSYLAARLILDGRLGDDQEVLIVTLTNSAVDNFTARIEGFLSGHPARPLLPYYRVRTLHGLAHDIVRERPDLVGLDSSFIIIDEREAAAIRDQAINAWLGEHPSALDDYLDPDLDENARQRVRRDELPRLLQSIALAFIRTAKDRQLSPTELNERLAALPAPFPLAEMGAAIYADYQRALAYRGGVDFDDLIRLALEALQRDLDLLARLQGQWPYILEDEAQDSSRLQERILRLLASGHGNWVRVGDPNQAIYESFTTADPRFLRAFIEEADYPRALPNSGRSSQAIIDLANYLIDWTMSAHPVLEARHALSPPHIKPTPAGDPQPNPVSVSEGVRLISRAYTPQAEITAVVRSLQRWLPEHPDATVAVLTPTNRRGFEISDALRRVGIEPVDSLLRSSATTRQTAGALTHILNYLADPDTARKLAQVYRVWRRDERGDPESKAEIEAAAKQLERCTHPEDFVHPAAGQDWLDSLQEAELPPGVLESLAAFRPVVQRWLRAIELPIDQLVLTVSQELFTRPADLAIAHKLAVLLRRARNLHPNWSLPELSGELKVIAKNERRFLGFDDADSGFNPDDYKGQVVVATVHKAKGLEWDRVYLTSVNNYDFPSGQEYDSYQPEKWFLRRHLNLEAETLAQLKAALADDPYQWYVEGEATQEARLEYVRERLRLLYVGITRARSELVITWNNGRSGNSQPALPLVALQAFLEGEQANE